MTLDYVALAILIAVALILFLWRDCYSRYSL
ncbi:Uncharacterised protein [Klebsiella pneumoniae]|uniref:Uncharacterized protein n=1 Tax=Klebsiella pneumoniae TaxID=573 RepID=A0A2X1QYV8_KLEPN|nr:Uncharacterised protein [Klebsiella pneumoniae]